MDPISAAVLSLPFAREDRLPNAVDEEVLAVAGGIVILGDFEPPAGRLAAAAMVAAAVWGNGSVVLVVVDSSSDRYNNFRSISRLKIWCARDCGLLADSRMTPCNWC